MEDNRIRGLKNKYLGELTRGGVNRNDIFQGINSLLLLDILDELKKLNESSVVVEEAKEDIVVEEIKKITPANKKTTIKK